MSFVVRKPGAGAVTLDDLGITLSGIAASEFSLRAHDPKNIQDSSDLASAISGGTLVVLDPRDDSTALSIADGEDARAQANDTHWGINGGRFDALDDPGTVLSDNFIVQYDLSGDTYESVDPATFIGDQTETIEDIIGAMGVNGTDTTFTYNDGAGTIEWSVDDSFLRNDGDTLDSGTLSIASGATLSLPSGSTITIDSAVTSATIGTPGGGFTGDTDIINKFYVDQVAAAIDWKESSRISTTPADGDILAASFGSGTYTAAGGPSATGQFTLIDLSSGTGDTIDGLNFTGVASTGLIIGDRVLIKDQTDATQNGIFFIDTGSVAASVILTRATDQDGVPTDEVSGGNTTFIEDTTAINATSVNSNTTWSVLFDGELTLNTDDMDWTQIAGPGSIVAGIGLSRAGSVIDLDVDDLVSATPVFTDTLAFHDADGGAEPSGSQSRKVTFEGVVEALDIPHDITSNGLVTRTAADTYTSRSIAVDGAGNLDGLAVADGDGVSGNPTIGLDIQNLPATGAVDAALDRVPVWDSSANANVYYTVTQIATATSANSFETWLGAGNTTGDASIVADSATDTANVTGGIGINVDLTSASDTITWSFTRAGMADTAVVSGDTIPFFDASNANEPEFRSFSDIFTDLGVTTGTFYESITGGDGGTATAIGADTITVNGTGINVTATNGGAGLDTLDLVLDISDLTAGTTLVLADEIAVNDGGTTVRYTFTDLVEDLDIPNAITVNGFVVRTAADTYASRTLDASVDEDEIGIIITDGDGVAGDPQIGLDIVGMTVSPAEMATTDEFPVHDKSEGTAGANREMTGQLIADGVETILGLTSLTFTDINGQSILTHIDTTRSSKVLSIDSHPYVFANNTIDDNEWMDIGDASNADVGITMPLDGTIVMATGQTEDDNGNTFEMDVYIDGVDSGSVGTLTGGANSEFQTTTVDLDFTQGQKIRVRGDRTAGSTELGDVAVVIIVRWRDIP